MLWQRSFLFPAPLTKQLKRETVGYREVTINNAATVVYTSLQVFLLTDLSVHTSKCTAQPHYNAPHYNADFIITQPCHGSQNNLFALHLL